MAAIYSNGGNRWNILDFNFTKRDALSSVYKKSVMLTCMHIQSQNNKHAHCASRA
jgi:ubiquinone biosynthesis protein COQ9